MLRALSMTKAFYCITLRILCHLNLRCSVERCFDVRIGILAGFLAGKITKGSGFGIIINLIVGVLGSLLGGWIFSLLGISVESIIGQLVMATIGTVVLLWIVSLFRKKRPS